MKRLAILLALALQATPAWADLPEMFAGWAFNEGSGTTAQDMSANNRDATLSGATFNASGYMGGSVNTADASDYVNCGTDDPFAGGTASGGLWVKYNGTSSVVQVLWSKLDSFAVGNMRAQMFIQPGSNIIGFNQSGGATAQWSTSDFADLMPQEDKWEHYAWTYDGSNMRLYKNGEIVGPARAYSLGSDTAAMLRIGSNGDANNFEGDFDHVTFYDTQLTDAQIQELYELGPLNVQQPQWYQVVAMDPVTELGSIFISGHCDDSVTEVEASFNGGEYVTIDADISNGEFSGWLNNQPMGSGDLIVRDANDTSVTFTQPEVGVGLAINVAGQSNAEGQGSSTRTYSGSAMAAMLKEGHHAHRPLVDPTGNVATGSFMPLLANVLSTNDPDRPLVFYNSADGGTGVVSDGTDPTSWAWDKQLDGASYNEMLELWETAGSPAINYTIWWQGEAEIYEDFSAEAFKEATYRFLDNLEADLGIPEKSVIICQIGQVGASQIADAHRIRNAQVEIAKHRLATLGPATYDINLADESGDSLHFKTEAEQQAQADRVAAVIDGRSPPQIKAITSTTGSTTVVLHYDDTLTTATLGTAPFTLTGTVGGARTVSAAAASGSTVSLTINSAAQSGEVFTADFAQANTGQGVTLPTSSTTGLTAVAQTFVQANGGVKVVRQAGSPIYFAWDDDAGTILDATEGVGASAGIYSIQDSELEDAGLEAGVYFPRAFIGNAINANLETDEQVAYVPLHRWDGERTSDLTTNLANMIDDTDPDEPKYTEPALAQAPSGSGATQPRINRKPAPGFTIKVSRRTDGTYKCPMPIRLTAGSVDDVYVFIDMSPLFGPEDFVETVGTAEASTGSITPGADKGPRDTYAVLELGGTADDDCEITLPVTMESGTTVPVVFDVEVLGE